MNILKRGWIPLLIVVVVAIAGFTVYRMHGAFGSNNEITRAGAGLAGDAKPFNPKRVTYEIFGPAGAVASKSARSCPPAGSSRDWRNRRAHC